MDSFSEAIAWAGAYMLFVIILLGMICAAMLIAFLVSMAIHWTVRKIWRRFAERRL